MITCLGFDPGLKFGIAVSLNNKTVYSLSSKFITFLTLRESLIDIIKKHKVNCFVLAQGMGCYRKVQWQHGKYSGICELVCEDMDISYFEPTDTEIRKTVMKKGNAKKPDVQKFVKCDDSDEADAILASLFVYYSNNKK